MAKALKKSSILVSGFIDYLKNTRQENLLPDVTKILEDITKGKSKTEKVIVTSAVALSGPQKEQITNLVNKLFHKKIPLENKLNGELLGGFTVKVGDWFLDASLKRDLNSLKKTLLS